MLGQGFSGRYEVKDRIGHGGMGEVYRAFDRTTNRDVTIKTLLDFRDEAALVQFRHECSVLASLNHPNIVDIYDIGDFEGRPYFVMPLLPGKTLAEVLQEESLSPKRAIDIISQACRGLHAAHSKGLIHRDLKPSNIFVLPGDSVKIIDFGVAGVLDSRSTMKLKGTLLYMSPEQTELRSLTPQSDLFSLAVVTYEALAGRRPFEGANAEQIIRAIRTEIQPPITELRPEIGESISQVVHKALAKTPSLRFSSVEEFAEYLVKALNGQPIEIFNEERIRARLDRARQAATAGDYQLAGEIVRTLESETYHPEVLQLRRKIDRLIREERIQEHLSSARQRFDVEEDELALERVQTVLDLDPANPEALGLKSEIEIRSRQRQTDRWVTLARQHIENNAFSHAREALDKILAIDATHTEALTLLSDLQRREQDYQRVQGEKKQLYQAALDAVDKGELSGALSRLEKVIELDALAPDTMAGEREKLYERVRSQHQAVNDGYDEARRLRNEKKYREALAICQRMLAEYPAHALFSSLKLDLEADESQALSAYIAEVDDRVAAEPDLEAQSKILKEASERFPEEQRFQQRLRTVKSKSDLVKSIVLKARGYESADKFQDALVQWQTLRTVYPAYPGLEFEVERINKRIDIQTQDEAKARWVDKIEQSRAPGQWGRAAEAVRQALDQFPDDLELRELETIVAEGSARAAEANELVVLGRGMIDDPSKIVEGVDLLRKAYRLDPRNLIVSNTFHDALVKHAQRLIDRDWRAAEPVVEEALKIKPSDNVVSGLMSLIDDKRRSESVGRIVSEARQLERSGDFGSAIEAVRSGLQQYPDELRLRQLESTLAVSAGVKAGADDETMVFDPPTENAEDATVVYTPPEAAAAAPAAQPEGEAARQKRSPGMPRWMIAAAAVFLLVVAGAGAAFVFVGGEEQPAELGLTYSVSSTPPGAEVAVDGEAAGVSPVTVSLAPGEHQVTMSLLGYATYSQTVTAAADGPLDLQATLDPLPTDWRVVADIDAAQLTVNGQAVSLDNLTALEAGTHAIGVKGGTQYEASLQLTVTPGAAPQLAGAPTTRNLRTVVVASLGSQATVYAPDGMRATLDEVDRGVVTGGALLVNALQPGVRELALAEGSQTRNLLFETGAAPSVTVFVWSDRDVGDLYITSNETDVEVLVDGRPRRSTARAGKIRIYNIATGNRKIEVRKAGYRVEPASRSVAVAKGEIAQTEFSLQRLPQMALLEISGATAGADVLVDGASIGRTNSSGVLRYGEVRSGSRKIELRKAGYEARSMTRVFQAETAIRLEGAEVQLEMSEGALEFSVEPANASLELDPANLPGPFRGQRNYSQVPARLPLPVGTYNLRVTAPGFEPWLANLQLADGEIKAIRVDLAASAGGSPAAPAVTGWGPGAGWEEKDGWSIRKGPAHVPYSEGGSGGTFAFVAKLPNPIIGSGRPTAWAAGYKDRENYVLFELNKRSLTKSIVTRGQVQKAEEKEHGLDAKLDQQFELSIRGETVTLKAGGKVIDEWNVGGAAAGRFAFIVPQGKDLEMKDFNYRP